MEIVPRSGVPDAVLVKCSKNGREAQGLAELSVYADLLKVRAIPKKTTADSPSPGRAGRPITKFSKKSRKAMLERLATIRNIGDAYFVTLTYPGKFEASPEDVKRHLANLRRAMERRYPGHGAMWRLELKTRKSGESAGILVPHFHVLVFGVTAKWTPLLRLWLRHTWTRIVTGDDCGKLLRTQADVVTSRRHAASYVAKYAAKDEDDDLNDFDHLNFFKWWGRRWGTWGTLNTLPSFTVLLPEKALIHLKRMVRGWLKSRGSQYYRRLAKIYAGHGFSAFGLGDTSGASPGIENATILRMIFAAFTMQVQ